MTKETVSTFGGVAGGTGTSAGTAYVTHACTNTTIGDRLNYEMEGSNSDYTEDDWNILKNKLSFYRLSAGESVLMYLDLSSNSNELKEWCTDKKHYTYSSVLIGNRNSMLEEVKAFCYLTIRDKLGNKVILVQDNDFTPFNSKLETLKSSSNNDSEVPSVYRNLGLKKLKVNAYTTEEKIKELAMWCSDTFDSFFRSENDNDYKLAKKFCTYEDNSTSSKL